MQLGGKRIGKKRSMAMSGNARRRGLVASPSMIPNPIPKKLAIRGKFFRLVKIRTSAAK